MRFSRLAAALVAGLALLPAAATAGTKQTLTATVEGKAITVYSYLPDCKPRLGILWVFHGTSRTAASYRDAAIPLADRECIRIYAPLFDAASFPNADYHMGGVRPDGPTTGRTVDLVDDLIAWGLSRMADQTLPVWLYGHSAGGQFLSRVAAYAPPSRAARIIVANPSTWVLPTVGEDAPYGFDMTTDDALDAAEAERLRAYLAAPMTVYLGSEDHYRDSDLATGPAAERQGANRLERGTNTYEHGRQMAAANGWPFGWSLVIADGIGHAGGEMMRAPEMLDAMATPPVAPPTVEQRLDSLEARVTALEDAP